MSGRPQDNDRNQEATVYLGNLDDKCTDAMIWELMLQAGPVVNVHLPKDRISMSHQGFGFCEFATEEDADYACKIMNQIKLWGKPIRVNKASYDKKQLDVGANLFIGGLDAMVDEGTLFTTFSAFGPVSAAAKIARDPQTGESKGYGFVSYNDFDAADAAVEQMNGQYLMNKQISVQYAFKKDGKGERHGTEAERLLAAQAKKHQMLPTGGPGQQPQFGRPPQQGPPGFTGGGYPGQYAGALTSVPPPPPGFEGYQAQPPAGMPIYQPPQGAQFGAMPPAPPMGFPPQNFQQQQQPQGYPPMGFPGQNQGYGAPQGQFGMMPPQGQYPGMGMGMGMGMMPSNGMMQNGIPPPPPGFMQQAPIAQR